KGGSTSTSSARWIGWGGTSTSGRTSATGARTATTTSTGWSAPAGAAGSGSSARTAGIARGPRPSSPARTRCPGPGAGRAARAPAAYLNAHEAPDLGLGSRKALRDYVDQGGLLFAEACCGRPGFDAGFRAVLSEIFPEPEATLHRLDDEHPVWRVRHRLDPDAH